MNIRRLSLTPNDLLFEKILQYVDCAENCNLFRDLLLLQLPGI